MVRSIHRLSSVAVRNAKPGMHPDGGGLYLQATESANHMISKSWVFRFATGRIVTSATGKSRSEERQMGLGSLIDVSLAEARERAAQCRSSASRASIRSNHGAPQRRSGWLQLQR